MEDSRIIELFWERAEDAISETDRKYGKYCHAIAYNILHSDPDSEECVNDTYLRAWETMPPQKPNALSAYLGRITRNLALNRLSYKAREKRAEGYVAVLDEVGEMLPDASTMPEGADDVALREAINSFLRSLDANTRIIFVRRYWYDSAISEIATDYSIPVGTVKSTLSRTRKRFRHHLEKEGICI
ncbi:MAG: sigma-70 family RNA polymerase sigma factor [Clostridia bacterium]|nr:sigma-70 family RNA polymerase sigma factor [Clostridia bacterium]MBQ2384712.1 sigma-70 family RNA polymerase sigma factor [Clostridia bacterium]